MRKHIQHLGWVAGLLLASPAFAGSDADFVEKAASGGMMEVKLGEYAAKHAARSDVRSFGQQMAAEHAKSNRELESLAKQHGLTVPAEMSEEHRAMAERLMKMKGEEFDRAYMDAMVDDHQEDVEAFRAEAKDGQTDIDRWAAKTVPTLEQHLAHARELDEKVSATASSREGESGGVKGTMESIERGVKERLGGEGE